MFNNFFQANRILVMVISNTYEKDLLQFAAEAFLLFKMDLVTEQSIVLN